MSKKRGRNTRVVVKNGRRYAYIRFGKEKFDIIRTYFTGPCQILSIQNPNCGKNIFLKQDLNFRKVSEFEEKTF